jgi:hypothetical protein
MIFHNALCSLLLSLILLFSPTLAQIKAEQLGTYTTPIGLVAIDRYGMTGTLVVFPFVTLPATEKSYVVRFF